MAKKVFKESNLGGFVISPKGLIGKNQEIDEKGIFSERIFGPIHSFRCKCGNLKTQVLDAGKICPKCGVICGPNSLRLKTFGKIKLVFPVIKPTKRLKFNKITGRSNKTLIEPKFADASKSESRYLAVQKDGEKLIIVNTLDNTNNYYTIPFRITGIYSFILALKYVAKYLNLDVAKNLFDKEYIVYILRVIPPDLRMARIDPERSEIRTPKINDFYTSILNLNKSHGALLVNLEADEESWLEQINTNVKNGLWNQEIVEAAIMEMDSISARYQYFIDCIYQEVYDQLSGKLGLIRSSILGRTIEFSARSVIRVDPSLSPYEIKVSKKILFKLWHPYFLHYLSNIKGLDFDFCFENISSKNYEDNKELFNEFLDWFKLEHVET
jgi:DNA-directed RNA polymerase subunit beta'